MSELAQRMLAATSKQAREAALLVLEDGAAFQGIACGASGEVFGEICFNTALEGYLEVVTDPSYAGQVVVMTYPQIGNYGVNPDDQVLDRPVLAGVVMRDLCYTPSSFRLTGDLPSYLRKNGIVGIEGVDTRALAMHLRDAGPLAAIISTVDLDPASLARRAQALNATTEGREI